MQIALFPLKTVLLPYNQLNLKIFEQRYSDLIADCMRNEKPFGVITIYRGEETETDSEIFSVGTTARITDWQQRDDGLLGITVTGESRFEILSTDTARNGLIKAEVQILEEPEHEDTPEQYEYMVELLEHINSRNQKPSKCEHFDQAVYQLIYHMPLDLELKQHLLELPDSRERADVLHAELIRMGVIQYVKSS